MLRDLTLPCPARLRWCPAAMSFPGKQDWSERSTRWSTRTGGWSATIRTDWAGCAAAVKRAWRSGERRWPLQAPAGRPRPLPSPQLWREWRSFLFLPGRIPSTKMHRQRWRSFKGRYPDAGFVCLIWRIRISFTRRLAEATYLPMPPGWAWSLWMS